MNDEFYEAMKKYTATLRSFRTAMGYGSSKLKTALWFAQTAENDESYARAMEIAAEAYADALETE